MKKKRPRGRPPSKDPATARFELKLRPDEKEKYQRAAAKAGMSLAAWLKALADRAS